MAEPLHIQQQRKLEFMKECVEKFIRHKKIIFNKSKNNEPLRKVEFLNAIDKLQLELGNAKDYSISGYANVVMRNEENFRKLLPHPNNDSYKNSLNCLDAMQGICKYYQMQQGNA